MCGPGNAKPSEPTRPEHTHRSARGTQHSALSTQHLAPVALVAAILLVLGFASGRVGAAPEAPASQEKRGGETAPSTEQPDYEDRVEAKQELKDAAKDDWDTEVYNDLAGKQLKTLGKLLGHPEEIDAAHLSELAVPSFASGGLRPGALQPVFQDGALTVVRPLDESPGASDAYRGLDGLAVALRELAAPFGGAHEVQAKFKIIHVTPTPEGFTTVAYYLAWAQPESGAVQQNATWTCNWRLEGHEDHPLLEWIGVEKYEEVTGPPGAKTLYADCTRAVLEGNESFAQQLALCLDHWRACTDVSLGIRYTGHEGLAVGDVNGDGLDDLFVCQPGGLPNRLFVQLPNGTARDASAEAGVDFLDLTTSALLIDIDNDGDQDLVLAVGNDVFFLTNNGQARFLPSFAARVKYAHSLSAADYDEDGDLDVYVCCYSDLDRKDSAPAPYHDANNGRPNVLLRNDGPAGFTDATAETGLNVNNTRFSFVASWDDYDNDGDVDLYVANDYGRNNLYRNDGGRFVDVAPQAGAEEIAGSMSVSWGDYNNDGWMDLYISHMFSSAGHRITFQPRFKADDDQSVRALYRHLARGNTLLQNLGDGTFRDVSVDAAVTMGRWAWSSNFLDVNNDGLEDIFVANGFMTNDDTNDL